MSTNESRIQLATLIEELPVSKSSIFELLKNMGIERQRGCGPDGKNRVAWIAHDDAESLTDAAKQVANGSRQIRDFIPSKKRDRKGAQLALEMEPALMERLRAYSATDGRSISTLVRRWIELGLDSKTDLAESQIPRTEFTDLVDIVTLMRDEVTELAKWRQAQDILLPKEPDTAFALDVSVADLERRWGISRNALKARAKALGIELQRKGPTLTVWPKDRVADGDCLDAHCKSGGALATFKLQKKTSDNLHPMAELATRWGITANTVSRRIAFLGIKPERRGNLRYIEAGELALGDALQAHIVSGKPMELFMPAFNDAI